MPLKRLAFLWVVVAFFLACPKGPPQSGTGPGVPPAPPAEQHVEARVVDPKALRSWEQIDALISEQKIQEALGHADNRLEYAKGQGDQAEWARALITVVQLRTALHGYETTVRFLREQPWPRDPLQRAAVQLFYANALIQYVHVYQWEIRQRERVDAQGPVDLKRWTTDQIYAEAQRAFQELWEAREQLGDQKVEALSRYIDPNDYPRNIRGSLRDALTYLRVRFYSDTTGWRPEHQNEIFRLDFAKLLTADEAFVRSVDLVSPEVHPLVKIAAVLGDLEQWHRGRGEPEAALEAFLERTRRLHASAGSDERRAQVRAQLEKTLATNTEVPWWAMGMSQLSEFQQEAQMLVRARDTAAACISRYPKSLGGQKCLHQKVALEAPEYSVASMANDGPKQRSIQVEYKNLKALYFRAYPVDLERRVASARDYNLLPAGEELKAFLDDAPFAEWTEALPPTPDLTTHRAFSTPPITRKGLYVILASARQDFALGQNQIVGTTLLVTDLALISRQHEGGVNEVHAFNAATGEPAPAVDVTLYAYDYRRGHHAVETRRTNRDGYVRFEPTAGRRRQSFFILAKQAGDLALETNNVHFYEQPRRVTRQAALVYTDRSIYRPLQTLHWKVIAFEGTAEEAKFRTQAELPLTVSLVDANGQVVETKKVRTNTWGSASGEFNIPTGRLLGHWRIRTSPEGQAVVRVEEYKRPTFEAELKPPTTPLRLNKKALLTGEARYYFGLPVVEGDVRWRVTREPLYPWWWGYWSRPSGGAVQTQVIATGTSPVREDGTFEVAFTPEAEEPKSKADRMVSYRYRVVADVTDPGGETRTADKAFRLGWVSVEAALTTENGFFTAGAPVAFEVLRTDLNGTPRPGKGRWRVVQLQPDGPTQMPANEPIPLSEIERAEGQPEVITPGDRLRPRWDTEWSFEREVATWKDGATVTQGELVQGEQKPSQLKIPVLPAGAYKLVYETVDDFGAAYETFKPFVVAADGLQLAVPALLGAQVTTASVGDTVRFLVTTGFEKQPLFVEVYRAGKRLSRRAVRRPEVFSVRVGPEDRGGFTVSLTTIRDHQLVHQSQSVFVPWDDKKLKIEFATFRDLLRPGAKETWKVTVRGKDENGAAVAAGELLSYMYDASLDVFAPHTPPTIEGLYPTRTGEPWLRSSFGQSGGQPLTYAPIVQLPPNPTLEEDRLKFYDGYGIGGVGYRRRTVEFNDVVLETAAGAPPAALRISKKSTAGDSAEEMRAAAAPPPAPAAGAVADALSGEPQKPPAEAVPMRENFAETAFWEPHLLVGKDGSASVSFTVPDSVTAWNVWVHGVTRDFRGGSLSKKARSVKELMVRPYLPRFLRESDQASIQVAVNNASDRVLEGAVEFDIIDVETQKSVLASFGLEPKKAIARFKAEAGKGANVSFPITAPKRPGQVAFKIVARAGDLSDGELRPVPVLPSRMHLVQSRFATLQGAETEKLTFADMAKNDDSSLIHDQLVVSIDAQLFYVALEALPYLINYPYESTEQTLNRFVSTGVLSSLYDEYPAVSKMAKKLSARQTPLETWDARDPNLKMAMEETPWLVLSRGGEVKDDHGLTNVLDPQIAKAEREASIAKLRKAQTSIGGFPWFPGGPPSPYMTAYILHGLARAAQYGVPVPKEMTQRAWGYLAQHFRQEYAEKMIREDCCWEFLTFLNYVATSFPDPSYTGDALTPDERQKILDHSFKHWKQHSPYLKGYLALTLKRMNRAKDAELVWASVMDSAKTTEDQGTFWAPEDRSWLWYNDAIETHAFALQTLMELAPKDARRHGLVQWLLINKKLNHWKSTRATAEVIYALVQYLEKEGALAVREDTTVQVGPRKVEFVFEPDEFTGKKNQIVIPGEQVDPKTMSTVTVSKTSKGFSFASATWHFSTDKLPTEDRGDFFSVSRTYYKREKSGREATLRPLAEGTRLEVGDEVEIHLSLRTKHAAEYVHLRDPRAAGMEPENAVSRYKWDLGIYWYEETRDSGTNFFFEYLPVGEYTFRYRLRVNMAGDFRVGPATVQSMYAPEFNAYSAGHLLQTR